MGLTERHWFENEEPELTERQLEDAVYKTKEKSYYGTVKEFIKILEKMQGHKPESINMTQSFYNELKKEIENTWPMVKQAPKHGVETIMGVKINMVE